MNKTQRWNYEDLQSRCDQIAAMGKILVDFADGTLCDSDPENVKTSDIQRADAIISLLSHIFSDRRMQAHCAKLGIDTSEDWTDINEKLPTLLNQIN